MGSDLGFPIPPGRDWYMNGNYLVILVSVTIILPLALMRQLGEYGSARALEGHIGRTSPRGSPVSQPLLPRLCRLPGLLQRLLPQLHGILPNRGESLSMVAEGGRGQVSSGLLCWKDVASE